MLVKLDKLADLLGEGFLADRVVNNGDFVEAINYANDIRKGRKMVENNKLGSLQCLHRYVRFLFWIVATYGDKTFDSKMEAEAFQNRKINGICRPSRDFDLFWGWLRKVTLTESSALMPQP